MSDAPTHHQFHQREINRIREFMRGHPDGINRSANEVALQQLTKSDNLADRITALVGSWRFILTQSALLAIWLLVNSIGWLMNWDPYPFILLNLVLSFQAAFTAPVIMMSQNRQSARDRIVSELDFEVNRIAAQEVDLIQEKLDLLTSIQWDGLLEMLGEHKQSLTILNERTVNIEKVILESRESENPV